MHTNRPSRVLSLTAVCVALLGALVALTPSAHAAYVPTGTFSGPGTGDGELSFPGRAAVEQSTGNLFVADTNNDRVQVFTPDGSGMTYLTQFGAGALDGPYGIAIHEAGGQTTVYVSSAANNQIVRFESDEQPTPSFTVDPGFTSPTQGSATDPGYVAGQLGSFGVALATDPATGDLLVADRDNDQVNRYQPDGTYISSFDGSDSPAGAFAGPIDIAVDSTGDVLVVDASGDIVSDTSGASSRVERFSSSGAHEATVGPVDGAGSVTVDPDDDRVVVGERFYSWYTGDTRPRLAFFAADGTPAGHVNIDALWAIVPGLAAAGGGSTGVYAITTDPFEGGIYGPTGGHIFDDVPGAGPPQTTIDVDDAEHHSATITGTVDPNLRPTTYELQYRGGSVADWTAVPGGSGDAGNGADPIAVEATLEGLDPNTAYEVRLTATNDIGAAEPAQQDFTTGAVAPVGETLTTLERTTTTAHLTGRLNPQGTPTSYRFEYGTTTSYGQLTPTAGAGGGQALVSVAADITGLQPNTTYHYRLIATNSEGTITGEDRTVTTRTTTTDSECANAEIRRQQRAEHVGSCRAYELVNPADINQNFVVDQGPALSEDGERALWLGTGGMHDAVAGGIANPFRAQRTAQGWKSVSVLPGRAQLLDISHGFHAATADFSRMVARSFHVGSGFVPSPPGAAVRLDGNGGQEILEVFNGQPGPAAALASHDLSHVFVGHSTGALVAEHPPFTNQLYDVGTGQPQLVGLLPDDSVPQCGLSADPAGFPLGDQHPQSERQNWVSRDGSRVVFHTSGNDCSSSPQLYLREGGLTGSTTWVSEPAPGGEAGDAHFVQATPDLSQIIFLSGARLVVDGPLADVNDSRDVYRYTSGDGLECVTCIVAEADVAITGGDGSPSVAVSQDGSRVYFTSTKVLLPGYRGAVQGESLYVIRNGVLDYVAQVMPGRGVNSDPRGYMGSPAALSDDGSVLIFSTEARITDFDNSGPGCDRSPEFNDDGCSRIYRYSDADGSITCLSCPRGNAPQFNDGFNASLAYGGIGGANYASPMSDDGSRVAFVSGEALARDDTNGSRDIYEWVDGEVSLVTDGRMTDRGISTVRLFEMSADGRSILFKAGRKLVPELADEFPLDQLYVARAGGGFPYSTSVAERCDGDGCQGVGGAGRRGLDPASAGLGGPGDARPVARASFSVKWLTAAQRHRFARDGRAVLTVRVSGPGRVRATLRSGDRMVASGSRVARRAGPVRLGLRLPREARIRLVKQRRLRLALAVRFADSPRTSRSGLVLRLGRGDR